MAPIQTTDQARPRSAPESAVAWINGRQAIVATMARDGEIFTCEINRGLSPEPRRPPPRPTRRGGAAGCRAQGRGVRG